MWSRGLCAALALVVAGSARAQVDEANAFGRSERGTAALVGIFYDLKQTQQRKPLPASRDNYAKIVDQFLISGFDEAVLNQYFRAGRPLYTTQIITGMIKADAAPKAFGVAEVVKPSYWLIHYKGQVVPPRDGSYRFVGFADNVLVVAVNRRVVLVANLAGTELPAIGWKPASKSEPKPAAQPNSKYGDWVDLRADRPVDVDILIGERPGGAFHATLLYQQKGETYPVNDKGEIILPLFQVAPLPMADNRFLTDRAPWKCFE